MNGTHQNDSLGTVRNRPVLYIQNFSKNNKIKSLYQKFPKSLFFEKNHHFLIKNLGIKFLALFFYNSKIIKITEFFKLKWCSALRSAMMFQNVPH